MQRKHSFSCLLRFACHGHTQVLSQAASLLLRVDVMPPPRPAHIATDRAAVDASELQSPGSGGLVGVLRYASRLATRTARANHPAKPVAETIPEPASPGVAATKVELSA